jgi:hypothetical protein
VYAHISRRVARRTHPSVITAGDAMMMTRAPKSVVVIRVAMRSVAVAAPSARCAPVTPRMRSRVRATVDVAEAYASAERFECTADALRALDDAPGVFSVADADDVVRFVGCGKRVREEITRAVEGDDATATAAYARVVYLPTTARKAVLTAAWKTVISSLGYVPAMNAASAAMVKTPMFEFTSAQLAQLANNGYVVIDDGLGTDASAMAQAARELFDRGVMRNLGQEGRDDDVAVLASGQMPKGEAFAALERCSKVLLDIPDALRRACSTFGVDDDSFVAKCARATAPSRLMIARYPPNGGRYVAHLDNDPNDPSHAEGVPGLRACDRTFTCIAYLNPTWDTSHEGHFRAYLGPTIDDDFIDIAPVLGRIVVFDSMRILHEVRPSYADRLAMTVWT